MHRLWQSLFGSSRPVRKSRKPVGYRPRFEALEQRNLMAVFTVNSLVDLRDTNLADGVANAGSGKVTLRAAIEQANYTPGRDYIYFNLGTGAQTLNIGKKPNGTFLGPLPAITDDLWILGYTQPGYNNRPLIELNGANAGAGADGLKITGGDSVVQGLIINRFQGDGIELSTGGFNRITQNYIGTDSTGNRTLDSAGNALGNGIGVHIVNSKWNTITSAFNLTPFTYNRIAGNREDGVKIEGTASQYNVVVSSLIGTNGSRDLGNGANGVAITDGASLNTIGGTALANDRNIISGNNAAGVFITSANQNVVRGNIIGADAFASTAIGNGTGVLIRKAAHNTIGGTVPEARNIISGNATGIVMDNPNTSPNGNNAYVDPNHPSPTFKNAVQGNYIGVGTALLSGPKALPNGTGIRIQNGTRQRAGELPGTDRRHSDEHQHHDPGQPQRPA